MCGMRGAPSSRVRREPRSERARRPCADVQALRSARAARRTRACPSSCPLLAWHRVSATTRVPSAVPAGTNSPASTTAPEWVMHPRHDPQAALRLAVELGSPVAAAHALVNRGVDSERAAQRFLTPDLEDLNDPDALLDLDRAMARIEHALLAGERILVHGDYDVDGVTSTFLMYSVLRDLGARV